MRPYGQIYEACSERGVNEIVDRYLFEARAMGYKTTNNKIQHSLKYERARYLG